jgi:hypothetical protein
MSFGVLGEGFVLKNKLNDVFHCRTKNYLYLYNVMRNRYKKINLIRERNWWDYGVNPITGLKITYDSYYEVKMNDVAQIRKYVIVLPCLTTIRNIQSKRLSDTILDKRK